MRYEYVRKPKKCPECGSSKVARVLYGRPAFSADLQIAIDSGKIILGGCCKSSDDPKWQCMDCDVKVFLKEATINLKD